MPTNRSKTGSRSEPYLRSLAAVLLCLSLSNPGVLAEAQEMPGQKPGQIPAQATRLPQPTISKLDTDQRTLHLLNRFTFGPTPTDIADVRRLGVDRWLDRQLHPDAIPDAQLQARLAQFPALQLPVEALLERFPSGAEIRQAANGKRDIPRDPTLAAIYNRHIEIYEQKQAEKAKEQAKPDMQKMVASNETPAAAKAQSGPDSMHKVLMSDGTMVSVADGETSAEPRRAALSEETMSAAPVVRDQVRKAPSKLPVVAAVSDSTRPAYADLEVKSVLAMPPAQRVRRVLAMAPAEYEQLRSSLKGPQKAQLIADMNPAQRELIEDFDNPTRTVVQELQGQRLLRDIYSTHQLQEVMTTFWLNHFNVYLHKNEETPYYLTSYERDVIRPRALGNFEDLLIATAESPAMLLYLDNSTSTGPDSTVAEKQKQRAAQGKGGKATPPGLNENYARELMELHTLGVNGGYTQKDVTEVAKVLTGWTVDKPGQGGGFKFDETRHEPGKKLVMGKKFKENGQKEGQQLLHMLATSPATAHFISQELAVAFVSDTPPPALVDRMAKTFRSQHGDIGAVLKTLIKSPEFWAPAAYQAKVKTPLEYVVSAARASGADITNTQPLVNALNQMGMPLYSCVPPTGYPDKADDWVSTGALVTRMNFSLSLAANKFNGVSEDWLQPNSPPTTADQSEQVLEAKLIPTGISDQTRTAVLNQTQAATDPAASIGKPQSAPPIPAKPLDAKAQQAATEKLNAQLAGLLLGSPEFQRR